MMMMPDVEDVNDNDYDDDDEDDVYEDNYTECDDHGDAKINCELFQPGTSKIPN